MIRNILLLLLLYTNSSAQTFSLDSLIAPAKTKYICPITYSGRTDYSIDFNHLNVSKGYHNEGLSAILIDKKVAARSSEPLDILHINLSTQIITRIPVFKNNDSLNGKVNMGEIRALNWGFNNKLYISTTEPSHLIMFDPYLNITHDYGNPFGNQANLNNMSVGANGEIYCISRGFRDTIYISAFNPLTETFEQYKLVSTAEYGAAVQADNSFIYILTTRDGFKGYTINRNTKLQSNPTVINTERSPFAMYFMERFHDSIYFRHNYNNFYCKNGEFVESNKILLVPVDSSAYLYPAGIPNDTINYPLIGYNQLSDTVFWKYRNSPSEYRIKIFPTITNSPVSNVFEYKKDTLVGYGSFYSKYFNYSIPNNTASPPSLNTGSIKSDLIYKGKLYTSNYPGGEILELDPDKEINIVRNSFLYNPIPPTSLLANPRRLNYISGPQVINGLAFVTDTLLAYCGDINSDCSRFGDGAGIGTISISGIVNKMIDSSLFNYIGLSTVIGDNGFAYHSTKIYTCEFVNPTLNSSIIKHNTLTNSIEKKIVFGTKNSGKLTKGMWNQIIGFVQNPYSEDSDVYFLSEVIDDIYLIRKIPGMILNVKLGYDNMIWILAKSNKAENIYTFYKMNPFSGDYKIVFSFEHITNFTSFTFVGGDAYLLGNVTLMRIANLTIPVTNSYMSSYDKLNGNFNFLDCN